MSFAPVARAVMEALAKPSARPAQTEPAPVSAVSVARAAPLPPPPAPADERLHAARIAVVGMRESRAMAALAADIAAQLAEADPASAETLRTRLREVIEIGSARDTAGPLAALYAAARRDPSAPLARILASGASDAGTPDRAGLSSALADAIEALRGLDERFAARDFALAGFAPAKVAPAPGRLDLTI
jgi:hypothetical protein